jgi:hypothetical protein
LSSASSAATPRIPPRLSVGTIFRLLSEVLAVADLSQRQLGLSGDPAVRRAVAQVDFI